MYGSLAFVFRSLVRKAIASATAVAALSLGATNPGLAADPAQWTVLVYMNGKNNLEPYALTNFHDMAEIGGTADVNIVVEMGRPSTVR